MKTKRIIALFVTLALTASLAACGGDSRPAAEESVQDSSDSVSERFESMTDGESGGQETMEAESEEPKETMEAESEEAEEAGQEESAAEEKDNAGTEFLALLQEEYENGFFEGVGAKHTYLNAEGPFIYNGAVYIGGFDSVGMYGVYDIASKEYNEIPITEDPAAETTVSYTYLIDGRLYRIGLDAAGTDNTISLGMYDCNGELLKSSQEDGYAARPFEKGFFCVDFDGMFVLSYDFEKIADVPTPQQEVEHGLMRDVELKLPSEPRVLFGGFGSDEGILFAADGTIYTQGYDEQSGYTCLYRLNTDTYEWENTGREAISGTLFDGKYVSCSDGIYDFITGEQVFEYGELYCAPSYVFGASAIPSNYLCYFGGDKYLGTDGSEYRWVSLTDRSMSDPLPFPETYEELHILDDTYCVYLDEYGYFLWNYNDGTEEPIMVF